jgi:signal transduction histidine kinase
MPQIEFNISTLIILAFGVINFPLSIWIYLQNPKSWTNKLFSLLVVFLTIYLVINTELYIFTDYDIRLFLGRFIMANGAILNLLVFLFLAVFPGASFSISKKVFIPIILFTALLFAASFTNLIFESIEISEGNVVTPQSGVLMPLFGIHTAGLIVSGLILVYKKRKHTDEIIDKTRINYIFFAVGTLFFLILIFNFLFPVLFKFGDFVPLLPIYILIFLGIVSYAIVKHRLFGLKVLATQVLSVILWMVLFANFASAGNGAERVVDGIILLASVISGILLIRSVVSEVKQKEQLQELTEKLKALDKQKDEFLSMAAHELRSPMTAIKGYVSMVIEGDAGDIPEKARGFLTDTANITDRLIRLVNNMLNVSRIEEGRITFQEETENLSQPVRMVFSQFAPEVERKGLSYTLDILNNIKDKVIVDPDRIQEVVSNFISNAVKYTEKGFIKVKLVQNGNFVRLEVSDSGPGISKEEQQNLFRKFYRVESNVGKTIGTGLGLYISKLLIEKFKGHIGVDSEVGKGSTFWFEIPVVN